MIESTSYFGIELLIAALFGGLSMLAVVTFVHYRAARLTRRRWLEAAIPLSIKEIKAEEDTLRNDLETNVEALKIENSSQLAGLRKKNNAISQLTFIDALRDQLSAAEEKLVLKSIATSEAERALTDRESELAKLTIAFDECSALANLQKTEIVTLQMQLQTVQGRLTQACEETKTAEDRRNADRRKAEHALSDKESELGKVTAALNERSILADSQKAKIAALTMKVQVLNDQLTQAGEEARAAEERHNVVVREAERALSDKDLELVRATTALNERSVLADSQKAEIAPLTMKVQALNERLMQFGEEARAAEERHNAAVREAERALSDKDRELVKRTSALNERSVLANLQNSEIAALKEQVQTLNERLIQVFEETKGVQDCCDAAVRALSEKESDITRLTTVLEERSALGDSQIGEIAALTMQIQTLNEQLTRAGEETMVLEERRNTVLRVLSEKEFELARMTTALDERSVLAESQKVENAALTIQVQTLNERFTEASQEARTLEKHRDAAVRALSDKLSELATLTSALEQRSALVDAQKVENSALRTQVQALNERLIQAGKEARVLEERDDVERNELKAVTQKLNEERGRFKNFHGRVVSLVQQLTAQRVEDEDLHRRAQKDLENRLIEQSRLLNESECELTHLRGEIEIARKAEYDLRIAVIEIEGRANAATQNLIAEKAQLQAALDRGSGERARLVHELADLKRRQSDQAKAAVRVDNASKPEQVKDIAAERARRSVGGRLPQIA